MNLAEVARSTFYYYLKSKENDKYTVEKQEILEIFNLHKGRYGYRRILSVMQSNGYSINHKTVLKLMRELNLKGKQRKNGKYHSYKGEAGKETAYLRQKRPYKQSLRLLARSFIYYGLGLFLFALFSKNPTALGH